jgi:hypothetical protein
MPGTVIKMPRQQGTFQPECHIYHEQIQPAGLYPTFRNAVYISGGWHRQDRERVNSFGHQSYQKTRQNAFRQDSQELCLLRESSRRVEGMWSSELTTIEPIPG